jgi:PAS domain S-box-containing protein
MELGASDYLVKGLIDPDALERAIRHALERERGNKAIRAMEARHQVVGEGSPRWASDVGAGEGVAMFKAVFEGTRTGVAVVGLTGIVDEANHAFRGLFAARAGGGQGAFFLDLLDDRDREAVAKEFETLTRGDHSRFEAARRYVGPAGEVFWAHTTTALIRDSDGGPSRLIVMLDGAASKE